MRQRGDGGSTSGQEDNMGAPDVAAFNHSVSWMGMSCDDRYIQFERKACSRLDFYAFSSLLSLNFVPCVSPVRVVWRCWEEAASRSPISQRRMPASTPAWRKTLTPPSKRRPSSPYKVRSSTHYRTKTETLDLTETEFESDFRCCEEQQTATTH